MNTVKIMGGLGNQLFQYAFARSLERFGEVGIEKSFYTSGDNHTEIIPERQFLLDKFNCKYRLAIGECSEVVTDDTYDRDKVYTDTFFNGYWQCVSYFEDILPELKQELTLKDEYITDAMKSIIEEMKSCDSVSIHVRRTDYVTLNHECDLDYYLGAVETMEEMLKNPKFYVFSDDKEWCRKNLPFSYRLMDFADYQDFYLMSHAKSNIISNSTFSFWAALLNENADKVTRPTDWKGVPTLYDSNGRYL